MTLHKVNYFFLIFLLFGCSQVNSSEGGERLNDPDNPNPDWLISIDEVVDGGPGKNGIPSIDNPKFAPAHEIDFIDNERLVIGIKVGDEIKAYPHQILDWHEVVNDQVGEDYFSLTYCPLTGTGVTWNRKIDGEITTFGVSGLLYRNNLIAYDRKTDTYWSQMQMRAVNGPLIGKFADTDYPLIETTWATWKQMYPDSQVLTTETGYGRNYSGYAYGEDYLSGDTGTLFPITNENNRLPNKTLVHAYLSEKATNQDIGVRVFVKEDFPENITVFNENYEGNLIVAAGSSKYDFIVSYYSMLGDDTILDFTAIHDKLPVIMKDQEGNEWNVFGEAVSGPRKGEQLTPTESYNGYWFAISDFFPTACIYPSIGCKGFVDK
jgi:hypothetical protein